MNLSKTLCFFLALFSVTATAYPSRLDALSKEAARNFGTPEGRRYFDQFDKVFLPVFHKALGSCSKTSPDTKEPAQFIYVIAADGKVKEFVYSKSIPLAECMAPSLRTIKTLPRPPRDNWVVAFAAANHSQEERAKGPPDQPKRLDTEQKFAAYEKAIAPYVAKARATYPAAKKRFLAGLPPGYRFSVRVPLFDGRLREDSFVSVEKIVGGNITGTIGNQLGVVKNYKTGQRITFPESKIDNWLILRPDGTEEGNAVGKFLDHYRP
jgi:uncharacterized protein YegJ (DUF2314 family)